MQISVRTRVLGALLGAALVVGSTSAAVADEGDVVEDIPAIVTLSNPSLLTLPAGDGVRDLATVTITSDTPTTVQLAIQSAGGAVVGAPLPSIELSETNALSQNVTVPVDGLPAGALALVATPTVGEPASVKLLVGSGKPSKVALTVASTVLYSWSKSTGSSTMAKVSATDETGTTVPFAGTVTLKSGTKSSVAKIASKTGSTASTTISASGLPAGKASVTAKGSGVGSAGISSAARAVTIKTVAISSAKVSATSTVYPTKDGYKDSAKISVSASTTTGDTITGTGTVKITRSGKTVKTYKLTSSKNWSATWDGKVSGKVVPGTYTVKISLKGPQGATKTASDKIVVKKGKLVTKTTSTTYKASQVLKTYSAFDYGDEGYCAYDNAGVVDCIGFDAYLVDSISLISDGSVSVPTAVRSAEKFGSAKARVSLSALSVHKVVWGYGPKGDDLNRLGGMVEGTKNLGWTGLPDGTKTLSVSAALGEYSFFIADKIKVEYSYKVLSTK